MASGSCSFPIPVYLPTGTYEFRLYSSNTGIDVATSNPVTVNAGMAPISLTASPATVPAGEPVTVTWLPNPTPTSFDWIGLYDIATGSSSWSTFFVSCDTNPPVPGVAGSCSHSIPVNVPPGIYEFRLYTGGIPLAVSNPITVGLPLPPSKLAFAPTQSHTVAAGNNGGYLALIRAVTPSGRSSRVLSNTSVTISLKSGTGIMSGTVTRIIPAGSQSITIGPILYSKAEPGVVFTATATSGDSLAPADSLPVTFIPGTAAALTFTTQPGNSAAGAAVSGPPTVAVTDSGGNFVSTSAATVTMTIASPNYGGLYGTRSTSAIGGVATFDDLKIHDVGGGYTLRASAPGLSAVTSDPFSITAATGALVGVVSRADTGAPIAGASVEAFDTGGALKGSSISDASGNYSIASLGTGIMNVRASAGGFVSLPKSGVAVALGSTTSADFSLTAERVVYVYDALSRLKAVVDVAGQTATYNYDAVGNLLGISRYSSSQVSAIEFTPSQGAIGASVTIFGTGFSPTPGQNTVTFNGVSATVVSVAPTQIVALVPAGASTGPIGVTAPGGSATTSGAFTVTTAVSNGIPVIASFTPTIGVAGTAVTVTGSNFDPNPIRNDLRFGASRGTISASSATSISTTVPTGTGSGRISVTTAQGRGTSATDFFVLPPTVTAPNIEFTGRISTDGTPLNVAITTAGKKALIVFDGIAGQRIGLRASNSTFPVLCGLCGYYAVAFYRPDGSFWVNAPWGATFFAEPPALPVSGTYTMLFDPAGTTGQVAFDLFAIKGEDQGPITPGIPQIASIKYPGFNPFWTFQGTAGQSISLRVTDDNFPLACFFCQAAYLYIYRPNGQLLAQTTWPSPGGDFIDSKTLPESGLYTVVLDPAGGNTGRATITLYVLPTENQGTIIADGTPVLGNISTPGQRMLWSFSGVANQVVSLEVMNFIFACGWGDVAILKPDKTTLVALNLCKGQNQNIDVVALPQDGTYWVSLDGRGAELGQATLKLFSWPSNLVLNYDGKIRDRVGQGNIALTADGVLDGTFTVTLVSGTGPRTINSIAVANSVAGRWDTQPFNSFWAIGAASTLDSVLYNSSDSSVSFAVADGGTFNLFGADFNNTHFNSGVRFIVSVIFADGSRAAGVLTLP